MWNDIGEWVFTMVGQYIIPILLVTLILVTLAVGC